MTNLEVLEKMLAKAIRNNEHRKPQASEIECRNLEQKVAALTEAVELMQQKGN